MKLFKRTILAAFLVVGGQVCTMTTRADEQPTWQVTTAVQPKNVLMEEFTGTGCYWCPDGHAVAERMKRVWPGRVFAVNVHTGSLAVGYTTKAGDEIGSYLDCESKGYPCGDVNRTDFGEGVLIMRNVWQMAADYVMNEDAPVNLLMQSHYDNDSRQLDIHVEGYFTGTVTDDERLCVLLLQNNVWGYQNGPQSGDYCHMHMLRQALTDVWGDPIEEAAQGSYFARDYSLELPTFIGDVYTSPADMELVAFVSNGRTDVQQVTGGRPTLTGVDVPLKVAMEQPRVNVGMQYGYHFFEVTLQNQGNQPISEAAFQITVGQQTATVTAECDITPYGFQYLRLPMDYEYNKRGTTKYAVTLLSVNGTDVEPQTISGQFVKPTVVSPTIQLNLQTDAMPWQNTFAVCDEQGNTIRLLATFDDRTPHDLSETIDLEPGHTYCFDVSDVWGDGMYASETGYYELRDADGILIDKTYVSGFGARSFFTVEAIDGIADTRQSSAIADRLYDLQGRELKPTGGRGIMIVRQSDGTVRKLSKQ